MFLSVVRMGQPVSFLMRSVHLFLGLSLGYRWKKSCLYAWYTHESIEFSSRWPNHFNLFSCTMSIIVFSVSVVLLVSMFLILKSLDPPSIDRRNYISNTKRFFLLCFISRPKDDSAKVILLLMSLLTLYTKLLTFPIFSSWIKMLSTEGVRTESLLLVMSSRQHI